MCALCFRSCSFIFLIGCWIVYVMLCVTWYHLYILKTVENTHEGVIRLRVKKVKLKVKLLYECDSRFLNCTNGTKSLQASQLVWAARVYSIYIRLDPSIIQMIISWIPWSFMVVYFWAKFKQFIWYPMQSSGDVL